MFFFSLNLSFHAATSGCPLIKNLLGFFVTALFLQLTIFGVEPNFLKFLFSHSVGWVVVEIIGAAFKPILLSESDRLNFFFSQISRPKCFEW